MKLGWLGQKSLSAPRALESRSRLAVREQLESDFCAKLLRTIVERFPELDPTQVQPLVHDVVEQFFFEVMDIGASERYHHAAPWGLAHHSLEVAAQALRIARVRHFVSHAGPNPEEQEVRLPRLRYAAFLFGLYHDIGKVAQVLVKGPKRAVHNAFIEPVGAFYDRHGAEGCRAEWVAGRSLEGHVWLSWCLVGRIMPPASSAYLGPRLISEILEQKSDGARELHEIIREADQHSNKQARQIEATPHAPLSLTTHIARSIANGLRQGRISTEGVRADVYLGQRYATFRYPDAILKLVGLVKECSQDDVARNLQANEAGARYFLARLKSDGGLYADPHTGLWKLKATIRLGPESNVTECILIPRHLLGADHLPVFDGTIRFARLTDDTEVLVGDFENTEPPPKTVMIAPPEGLDPSDLVKNLVEGILAGWIPTNVTQAHVYATPKTTYVTTPAVFLRMRERGLYPNHNPQDKNSAFLKALATLDFVRKGPNNRIVYPIMLSSESMRPLKVIKFDTAGLFKTDEIRNRVGVWKDWPRITELPQNWRPGDAIVQEGTDG